ncbi:amidohydrolase family protein [Hamadaea tsunoensis]|uniref:amidohydrolase family protein n=1 Tax=Hamadaea tsunoensis TaxID=53368 RepID=UPI000412E3A1|nr:amidohydrolase family protein [Hamadaea tsunoensis]
MLLITNSHVVPGDGSPERPGVDLLIEQGVITAIGPDLRHEAAEVIDATGLIALPGLVDTHRHVWQAPLRGIGADMTLPAYLSTVLGRILPAYTAADAGLATLLGAAEALDAGITSVLDYSNAALTAEHRAAIAEAYASAGQRAIVATETEDADQARAILGPDYGPYEVAAEQIRQAQADGVLVTMHVQGGREKSPLVRLHEAGLLGPRVHLVHGNEMSDEEAKVIAASGAGVTVTPLVEGLMGHGVSAYGRLVAAGARPALGTDVVVNAAPDLFEVMRDTLRAERLRTRTMVPAASMITAATQDGSRVLGLGDRIGSLVVGKRADVILAGGLAHVAGDRAGAAVTTLRASDVDTVIVDGRVVKRSGRLVGLDLAELRARGTELARRVTR